MAQSASLYPPRVSQRVLAHSKNRGAESNFHSSGYCVDLPTYGVAVMDDMRQLHEELQARTIEALKHAAYGIPDEDDVKLLCWQCGVPFEEIKSVEDAK